jgi:ribosome-binding factor A
MSRRMERINALLRQEISSIVASDISDPRLSSMITVTRVDTAPDLSRAKVYVSIMGHPDQKKRTLKGLKSASGFVRRGLRPRLTLRTVPEVEFHIDDSIERGTNMLRLIDEAMAGNSPIEPEEDSPVGESGAPDA